MMNRNVIENGQSATMLYAIDDKEFAGHLKNHVKAISANMGGGEFPLNVFPQILQNAANATNATNAKWLNPKTMNQHRYVLEKYKGPGHLLKRKYLFVLSGGFIGKLPKPF
jgi:hypothetical protein